MYKVRSPDEVTQPTVRLWIDFTLTSVDRGYQAVRVMGGRKAFRRKRVLDVGCAYGGFLVAAAHAGASQVAGLDIDERLLDLARLQLADYGIEGKLIAADVTASDLPRRLESPFDMILCNDVIEHVVDPEALARNLSALLPTGGMVYLQLPNGLAVEHMRRDPHYGLFGLTLLNREQAERWFRLHYPNDRYDVEHFASLAYYMDIFSRHGISISLLDRLCDEAQIDRVIDRLAQRFDALERELAALSGPAPEAEEIIAMIRSRGSEESARFRRMVTRYRGSGNATERIILGRTLFFTYGLASWQLKGVKLGP